MHRIARIVKSNSHVHYVGRVIDQLDASEPPSRSDYGFAQFVSMPVPNEEEIVGVIYDTALVNPDYGGYGPRLSPRTELSSLTPNYIKEQGILLGILLVGWRETSRGGGGKNRENHQEVPRRVIPLGQEVLRLSDQEVRAFHLDEDGAVQFRYYSQIIAHAGAFAIPLVEAIIEQLENGSTDVDRRRLLVLKKSLAWQRTLGGVRL